MVPPCCFLSCFFLPDSVGVWCRSPVKLSFRALLLWKSSFPPDLLRFVIFSPDPVDDLRLGGARFFFLGSGFGPL